MPLSADREIYFPENSLIRAENHFHPLNHIDLSFQGVDTQYSTHCIHPYVAAINPPLVSTLIDNFVPDGGSILDPYCGGGGVLVEGIIKGKSVTGSDINPLATSISRAKTEYIPKKLMEECIEGFLRTSNNIVVPKSDIEIIPNSISYWFKDYMLEPILKIKKYIASLESVIENEEYKSSLINFIKVVFSATIRDVMLTYRGEVRLRKLQGIDLEKFNPDVFCVFKKRACLAIEKISALPHNARANISLIDARNMPYADNQFSTIICSPPYGDDKNGVGYFQFSSKMLYFLGFEDVKEYKKMFLGGLKDKKTVPPSARLLRSLENVYKRNQNHYNEAVAFYSDYFMVLQEMRRVAYDRIIVVVGNRVLSRTSFDNAKITVEMFEHLGINLEYYFQRTLPKKRIANLGGDGGGGNIEHILIFHI